MAIYDAATNTYVDTATGSVSADPYGREAVTNPSLVSQARRNLAVSSGFLDKLAGYGDQFSQAVGGENELARHLSDVIAGRAPSVAEAQLELGLGQIRQQADSQASGASGNNAALARIQAIQSGGEAQATANQTAALLRAEEVANAERNKGAVLGNVANQSAGMYGSNLSGAATFSGQAGNEAAEQAKIDEARHEANLRLITNLIQAGGATAATIATAGGAPAASAAAQGVAAGLSGNAAANSAGPADITQNLPAPVANPNVTNEDLLATPSTSTAPSAADTHALVNNLASLSPDDRSNLVNTGLSSGTAYTSDRREKKNIKRAPIEDFLDHIAGFTFDYKHPGTPGEAAGTRISPMAQDVAKSPMGRTMVVGGKPLQMDIPNAVGGALAAVAYLNDEIKQLKKGRK